MKIKTLFLAIAIGITGPGCSEAEMGVNLGSPIEALLVEHLEIPFAQALPKSYFVSENGEQAYPLGEILAEEEQSIIIGNGNTSNDKLNARIITMSGGH